MIHRRPERTAFGRGGETTPRLGFTGVSSPELPPNRRRDAVGHR